jgi:hypothetical protein
MKNDMKNVKVGSWVQVRVRRYADGSGSMKFGSEDPRSATLPLVRARVTAVNVCGVKGCMSLAYEDGSHIGLPFYDSDLVSVEG